MIHRTVGVVVRTGVAVSAGKMPKPLMGCEPMNPAAPVSRTRIAAPILLLSQAGGCGSVIIGRSSRLAPFLALRCAPSCRPPGRIGSVGLGVGWSFWVGAEQVFDAMEQAGLGFLVVHVAQQFGEAAQGQDVDVEVVFGFDAVPFGGAVLAEQDQRCGVGGLGGEQQVEQDERVRVERAAVQVVDRDIAVVAEPDDDQDTLGDDESPGTEDGGDPVGDPRRQWQIVVSVLVGR